MTGPHPAAAQVTDTGGGDQIMVTAQRRPELAEDVPISLTAKSGELLERMEATEMAALGNVVPSLVVMRTGAFTQPYLRGVGKRSTLGVENSVATYVDGVYLASSIGALLDLRGIERVEVLNGPQGTLFGRNATGGVIQIVTRGPMAGEAGEAAVDAGTHGYLRSDLYLSGGDDRLAGNLAMSLSRNSGYGTNLYSGRTSQGEIDHSLVARSKWVWRADAGLTLTLAGDYQDLDQDYASVPAEGYVPVGQPRIQGFRDLDQDTPARYRLQYGGLSLKAEVDLNGLSLMSLTAVRGLDAGYNADLDLGPSPLFAANVTARQDQLSQEFQLRSATSAKLQWLAGLYFIRIAERYDPTTFSYSGSYSTFLGGRTGQALFSRGTAASYAAYGQGTLPVGDETNLTLGLRHTVERRSVHANGWQSYTLPPPVRPIAGLPLGGQTPFSNEETFSKLTWHGSLDRQLSDEVMAYVAVSRGFRSGGWNLQTPQAAPFGPETLDNFEAGVKFADRTQHVRADMNVFYYDYRDVQVSAITPIGSATVNAASAETYGLELQLDARPDHRTGISLGLAWLHSRFDSFPNASCVDYNSGAAVPYAPMACDVTGNHLPFAPELKGNVSASRLASLGNAGALMLSANLAYNSGFFAEPDNAVRQRAYATVDASAEWQPPGSGPKVRLWVTNLTDARYFISLVAFPTAGVLQSPAAPRRAGVSLTYDW